MFSDIKLSLRRAVPVELVASLMEMRHKYRNLKKVVIGYPKLLNLHEYETIADSVYNESIIVQ